MPLLFALTLFVAAALLFSVQPMIAKMVLPLLGGAPAVWTTCMVFFQAALLAGYLFAHAAATRRGVRRQAILHGALLLAALASLPFGVSADAARTPAPEASPSVWLLGLLATTVGLPFVVVAATAPLLQRWFSRTGHPAAADPYPLYAASNAGSLLALLAYPLALEPHLTLSQQSALWAAGFGVLVLLTAACAAAAGRAPALPAAADETAAAADRPGRRRRLRWVGLAFIPSSLMLGVTTYLSTDIVAMPLLWVVPLGLYLLTFILAFARRPPVPHAWMVRALPMAVLLAALALCAGGSQPGWIPFHLLTFVVVALACHGELARDRPAPRDLTGFYLALATGGVLGGLFNALVAPLVFDRIAEYPLVLALACLVRPGVAGAVRSRRAFRADLLLPLALGLVTFGLIATVGDGSSLGGQGRLAVTAVAVAVCTTFLNRPVRFALGVAAVLAAGGLAGVSDGRVLHQERSFFGVLRVIDVGPGRMHRLDHGTTIHGQQRLGSALRREPPSYYHRTGPIGQVFAVAPHRSAPRSVAVVGLGAGSMAAYAEPGQRWTFYEIDPAVARIARNPRYFTFLADCRAGAPEVVLGDARLRLRAATAHGYGLIVLDAFSSDAIPPHLLTREALRLYRAKLAGGGLIAVHLSNRFLDLSTVVGALARDAGWVCRVRFDADLTRAEVRSGKLPSIWAVLAARAEDLGVLAEDPRWREPSVPPGTAVWTDDYSHVIGQWRSHPEPQ